MPSNCFCLRRTNYHNNISDFHHKKLDCKQQFWWSNIFAQMPERNDWALRLATKLMLLPVCSFIFCLLFVFLFYCRLWNGWIDANAAWPCIWYKCRCTAQCTGQKSGTRCANICIRPTHRINHWHKHTKKKWTAKTKDNGKICSAESQKNIAQVSVDPYVQQSATLMASRSTAFAERVECIIPSCTVHTACSLQTEVEGEREALAENDDYVNPKTELHQLNWM